MLLLRVPGPRVPRRPWLFVPTIVVWALGLPASIQPAFPSVAHGFQDVGSIRGRVLDSAGRALADARVTKLGTESETVATDANGEFLLPESDLPLTLRVDHPAFEAVEVEVRTSDAIEVRMENPTFELELEVYAERIGDRYSPHALTSTAIEPTDLAAPPATLTQIVTQVPGVSENGQGGLFQVVSVRGISGQRVLNLIERSRITADRRAGVANSFVDPTLIGEVDVQRGPASTYYGSGAIGGAMLMFPRKFESVTASFGGESQGNANFQSAGWGNGSFSLGLARRASRDSEDADGSLRFDRFEQISGVATGTVGSDRRQVQWTVLPSWGDDIGKPNVDFPERATIYPRERHLLLRAALAIEDRWRARVFTHPNDLTTEVLQSGSRETVENDAVDLGAGLERVLFGSDNERKVDGRIGLDWFGRRSVDAVETALDLVTGESARTQTLDGAASDELALFTVINGQAGRVRVEGGARATYARLSNEVSAVGGSVEQDYTLASGFVGMATPLTRILELRANLGTGERVPNLSELFFSGPTGRGQVVGNPFLDSERGYTADIGMRVATSRLLLDATVFRTEIRDYIERIEIAPGLRSYRNLTSGTIEGAELDGLYRLTSTAHVTFGGHWLEGTNDAGGVLADIPPAQLSAGARYFTGPWSAEGGLRWRSSKGSGEVGPGEEPIPDAWILDLAVIRTLGQQFDLRLWGSNLLDQLYWPSADDQAVPATGRSIGLAVAFRAR